MFAYRQTFTPILVIGTIGLASILAESTLSLALAFHRQRHRLAR